MMGIGGDQRGFLGTQKEPVETEPSPDPRDYFVGEAAASPALVVLWRAFQPARREAMKRHTEWEQRSLKPGFP